MKKRLVLVALTLSCSIGVFTLKNRVRARLKKCRLQQTYTSAAVRA
jgi:hypothetical protein